MRVVRSPFELAARIHRPARPDRIVDEAIRRAQIARTCIGLLAGFWLVLAYPLREGAGGILEDKFAEVLISAGLLLVLGPPRSPSSYCPPGPPVPPSTGPGCAVRPPPSAPCSPPCW
ncbi:hypothetical protein KPP03845_105576 [Streptomyces xanthophaeus]|nr:hypothetical protein KPP03845_105576 [Streptomyces xanthophaeus]